MRRSLSKTRGDRQGAYIPIIALETGKSYWLSGVPLAMAFGERPEETVLKRRPRAPHFAAVPGRISFLTAGPESPGKQSQRLTARAAPAVLRAEIPGEPRSGSGLEFGFQEAVWWIFIFRIPCPVHIYTLLSFFRHICHYLRNEYDIIPYVQHGSGYSSTFASWRSIP